MRVLIIIILIITLKPYSSMNIRGEPFPKPNKKLQEDLKPKNQEGSNEQKVINIKNFRPSPPSIKRFSDDKILSKLLQN